MSRLNLVKIWNQTRVLIGARVAPQPIDTTKTALMIIDPQEKFFFFDDPEKDDHRNDITMDDAFMMMNYTAIFMRKRGIKVIYALYTGNNTAPVELRANIPPKYMGYEPSSEPYCVYPEVGDVIVEKADGSAFGNPHLRPYLESIGIENLLIAGGYTGACVALTDENAVGMGFKVCGLTDACWDTNEIMRQWPENVFGDVGARSATVDQVMASLYAGNQFFSFVKPINPFLDGRKRRLPLNAYKVR